MINDASLVMIPSGYKDGKLYSVKPTDGSGDFTFSRGSNLAATRVNNEGLIEKGRENLILQSNTFSAIWTNINTNDASGQTGYDGSNNAWKLSQTATSAAHYLYQPKSQTGVSTLSVYAKADEIAYIQIASASTDQQYANFDLSDGSVGNVGTRFLDAKITSVGNGWYRLSVVNNGVSSLNGFYIVLITSKTSAWLQSYSAANATDGLLIQDAQLEQGLVATDYIETTTTTAQAGILEDMPRLDYSGGSCPALLLEPQRSNIVANSEYMLDFIKSSATSLEANSATSPEGKNNATYYYCNTTSTNAYILQGWTGTSGVQYAVSFYAKAKELSIVYIKNVNDSGSQSYFDLSDGTFTLNSGIDSMSIEDAGEGWYRCTAVSTSTTTGIKWIPILKGDANEGVYVYGLQIEEGSYPTSYIPTYGASVTRGKDDMIITGSSSTSTTQGTIYVDFDRGLTSANERDASTDGLFFRSDSFPATDSFEISTDVSGAVRYGKRVASSFLTLHTDNTTDRYKSVFKWDNGAVKLYVNGTLEYQSASGFSITNILDEIGYSADFQKYVNKVVLFNSVLTDAEAIDLTTI